MLFDSREGSGRVPAGPIEQQDGVGALGDDAGDLVKVKLHGVGVREGQRQRSARAARRTDRAEEIGALVPLVGELAGPGPAPRPLPDEAVLLADPGLVPRVKPKGRLENQTSMGLLNKRIGPQDFTEAA